MAAKQTSSEFLTIKNYQIERKICRKICFTLYESINLTDQSKRFLKVLHPHLSQDDSIAFQFLNTANLAKQLKNNAICKVHDFGNESGYYIIESEPVHWKTLSLYIHEAFPFPMAQIVNTLVRIAQVLRKAHFSGIAHGLLNPGSIYIGEKAEIKIDDFGFHWIAPFLSRIDESEAKYLAYFIAPEFFQQSEPIDGRSDIYSLGIIFLQMLMGDIPLNGGSGSKLPNIALPRLRQFYPELFEILEKILKLCLNPNPEKRFFNLGDFIRVLQTLPQQISEQVRSREHAIDVNR